MNKYRRDIILVIKNEQVSPDAIDTRVEYLNDLIGYVDNVDGFCRAHELVTRYKITSNKNKIMAAASRERLRPFRFLLNKN
ncbi:hypothetical protein ABDK00_002265 [Niabella insulamsoli]|uniref:hypothetical protein n=1 Tax=Niabella insulamsoli TaxID=3144874 RepID=UPI0031FC0245